MDAQDFVRSYVSNAFAVSRAKPSINGLHNAVQEIVVKELQIPMDMVVYLHHSIHWSFFLEDNCPFERVHEMRNGEVHIKPTKNYDKSDIEARVKIIMDKHGDYIRKRLNKYRPAA